MSPLEEGVRAALGRVYDPCSVVAQAPLSVIDMGLLVDLQVTAPGDVAVVLRPTSAMCTLIASIVQAVEEQVGAVAGVAGVTVRIDNASRWTEEVMTEAGRAALAERRERSRREVPVKFREWETRPRPAPARATSS